MQFEDFEIQIKEALANLYDFAALERHPLADRFYDAASEHSGTRGEFLRKILQESIENLKPLDQNYDINAAAWRISLILSKRYLEGHTSQEVASFLALSERQYRRYLKRGVQSVALLLWDRFVQQKASKQEESSSESQPPSFSINREEIELEEVVKGIVQLLAGRLKDELVSVTIEVAPDPVLVESDRIILRQILIEIINTLLSLNIKSLQFMLDPTGEEIILRILIPEWQHHRFPLEHTDQENDENFWFWSEKLNLKIEQIPASELEGIEIRIRFPASDQKKILIVDDQEASIRLFTRYLSRSNVKIIGLSKPARVLAKARETLPELIILDIMMPKMDGWEVLQSLKLDELTQKIPVIVCSAWGEPELARSLGAVEFLRKPVTQRDLLAAIQALGVLN